MGDPQDGEEGAEHLGAPMGLGSGHSCGSAPRP